MNRKVLVLTVASSLLFSTLLFACVQVLTVEALIPSIVSVSFREVESTLWLDVVISHQPQPPLGPSHYVTTVQLEINGAGTDLTQTPQTTTIFTVQYNLGPNTNTYSVRARALCTPHGYGGWSATTTYPTPSPTPTPTPTSTPTPSIGPTPTPTPSPSQSPTPSPEPFPTTLAVASIATITVIGIGILVYFKKYRK